MVKRGAGSVSFGRFKKAEDPQTHSITVPSLIRRYLKAVCWLGSCVGFSCYISISRVCVCVCQTDPSALPTQERTRDTNNSIPTHVLKETEKQKDSRVRFK